MQIECRNNVKVVGEGEETIILAHGFGCNQTMWQNMLPYFYTHKVVLFDYTGSGYSDMSCYDELKYNSLQGYARDLLDVLEHLQLQHVTFVGHSVSGMIGLLASLEKPDYFKRLIMIGASSRYLNDEEYVGGFEQSDIEELLQLMEMNIDGWAKVMAPLVTDLEQFPTVTNNIEETFALLNPKVARQFAEVTFFSDNRDKLAACKIPTYLLQCAEDSIVPIEAANYLTTHIKGSEMAILNIKGHYPHISHPKQVAEMILNFLMKGAHA